MLYLGAKQGGRAYQPTTTDIASIPSSLSPPYHYNDTTPRCVASFKSLRLVVGVVELSRVKGLGPAKVEALQAAGITSAEELASVDLRKRPDIEGVKPDTLKAYKQRARQLLQSEGVSFEKAPYGTNKPRPRSSPQRTKAEPEAAQKAPAKRGLFSRLLRRK